MPDTYIIGYKYRLLYWNRLITINRFDNAIVVTVKISYKSRLFYI